MFCSNKSRYYDPCSTSLLNAIPNAPKDDCSSPPNDSLSVPTGDSTKPSDVPHSDKLDDKPTSEAPDLAVVIDAWADLPEAVRAGILAMVKASAGNEGN